MALCARNRSSIGGATKPEQSVAHSHVSRTPIPVWRRPLAFARTVTIAASLLLFICAQATAEEVEYQRDEALLFAEGLAASLAEPYRIEITASKDRWQTRYNWGDNEVVTNSDGVGAQDIRVPLGQPIVIALKSKDYIYTFHLPDFDLKEIAVPNREFHLQLTPAELGLFELTGEQLCGDPHSDLRARLIVQTPNTLSQWLRYTDCSTSEPVAAVPAATN